MTPGRPRRKAQPVVRTSRGRSNNRPQVPFAYKLVVNQWLLTFFGVIRFDFEYSATFGQAVKGNKALGDRMRKIFCSIIHTAISTEMVLAKTIKSSTSIRERKQNIWNSI